MRVTSIRMRLTLWYAATILVLLTGGALTVRAAVRNALEDEFTRSLDASATLVQSFFRLEIPEFRDIRGTLYHIASELLTPEQRVEFLQPDDSVLVIPRSPQSALKPLEQPVRLKVVGLDAALAPGWKVRITASLSSLERQQKSVDRVVGTAVVIAALLALGVGWILTGRTLAPVGSMATAADRISSFSSGRIPIVNPADEVGRLGTRFNALLDRLDDAMARQRRFLADAAHGLRTPIARARGTAELALSSPDRSGDEAALRVTQHELESMSQMVGELLELARAEAGGSTAHATVFLDDIATEAARSFDSLARMRNQRILIDVAEEVPVEGDAILLQRLVDILMDNALRYSADGGRVWISVARSDHGNRLEVTDEGMGLLPEERVRIFERFFRGVRARQAAPDGSGLGLAIAGAIASRHGAEISFETAPGGSGTKVSVVFPC